MMVRQVGIVMLALASCAFGESLTSVGDRPNRGNGAASPHVVEAADAYNCWPMVQSVGNRLICLYTRGARHNPGEKGRGTYAKVSDDGGTTWSDRVTVAQDERSGETPVAKGLDEDGAALFWVRRYGPKKLFALYRTRDGRSFEQVCEWTPDPKPMQITDVFAVPGVGLMAFWFGGSYADDDRPRWWGTVTSADNGKTWTQQVCGEGMRKADWPTEPSGVFLGNGRILAIARTEVKGRQFQLTSRDSGRTWKVERTNIDDVFASTPSLLYDPKTDLVTQYYYQRGAGVLRRRTARAADVFEAPTAWPASEKLVSDGGRGCDAGNANAVKCGDRQCVVYYTGRRPQCAVMSLTLPDFSERKD